MSKSKSPDNDKKYEETREWRVQHEKKGFPVKKVAISILIVLVIAAATLLLIFAISRGNAKV